MIPSSGIKIASLNVRIIYGRYASYTRFSHELMKGHGKRIKAVVTCSEVPKFNKLLAACKSSFSQASFSSLSHNPLQLPIRKVIPQLFAVGDPLYFLVLCGLTSRFLPLFRPICNCKLNFTFSVQFN